MRRRIEAAPDTPHTFEFSRSTLRGCASGLRADDPSRRGAAAPVLRAAGDTFLDVQYALQSLAIGEVVTTKERFTLVQDITAQDLYSQTDLDLGNRQVRRLRYHDGTQWSRAAPGRQRRRVSPGRR